MIARRPPPSRLPWVYFTTAHLFLAAAAGFLIVEPSSFVGFFYHPRMMVVVHLVTLGWITQAILGAIYWVAPMALGFRLPENKLDWVACIFVASGIHGMVSHFWLDSYGGMVWSALTLVVGASFVMARIVRGVVSARLPLGVRLHVVLACVNLLLTATVGILVGMARSRPMLPAATLDNVFAHLHLGALGWATMMAMGIGYRLLPMMLPSAMPKGAPLVLSAILLEVGVLWLAASFLFALPGRLLAALVLVAGIGVFFSRVIWMLHNRRAAPTDRPARDWGRLHAAQAGVYFLLAIVLGLVLVAGVLDPSVALRWAPVYGLVALLGALARLIVGVACYIFPYAVWLRTAHQNGYQPIPPAPHLLPQQTLQAVVFTLWTLAVPLLAVGLYGEWTPLVAAAGAMLLVAVALSAWHIRVMGQRARDGSAGTSRDERAR